MGVGLTNLPSLPYRILHTLLVVFGNGTTSPVFGVAFRLAHLPGHGLDQLPPGVLRKVRIPGRRCGLTVPEYGPDDREPKALPRRKRGEVVPEVVNPHIREPGPFSDTAPNLREPHKVRAGNAPRYHVAAR